MKNLFLALCLIASGLVASIPVYAQSAVVPEYEVGHITAITETLDSEESSVDITVAVTQGTDTGKEVKMQYVYNTPEEKTTFRVGEQVVVYKTLAGPEPAFFLAEKYRIPSLLWVFAAFAVLVVVTTRLRGVFAFVGLLMSGVVIIQFMIPQILDGKSPFLISTVGAIVILFVSLFTAHGFRPRTVIAAVSMTITILLSIGASYAIVALTGLNGLGSEEAFMVQYGLSNSVNMKGLLLGGIIIGVLGVLDDVATAQVAAVEELHRANKKLSFRELYIRGFSVGKEHIVSLVNTLVLAYAGASLPIFLLLTVSAQPLWVSINSEPIAEEIIRALVGSMALIVAVPLTTLLAAFCYSRKWFHKVIID